MYSVEALQYSLISQLFTTRRRPPIRPVPKWHSLNLHTSSDELSQAWLCQKGSHVYHVSTSSNRMADAVWLFRSMNTFGSSMVFYGLLESFLGRAELVNLESQRLVLSALGGCYQRFHQPSRFATSSVQELPCLELQLLGPQWP